MKSKISREEAFALLQKYNKEPFHIQHGLTVEGVMRWYANELGYGEEEDYWGIVGLLQSTGAFARGRCGRRYDLFHLQPWLWHLL